jgi:hypothetical protein
MRKRLKLGRPSHATVVAYLALFVALGGSAYAVGNLAKNSVGPKQLKKNAVTTAKVKNEAITGAKVKKGTLTGAQINVATLGIVPTAQTAESSRTAEIANSLGPPEPWHVVGKPGEPQFESGCKGAGGQQPPARFYKDHGRVVHLEGRWTGCPAGSIAFHLPPGYRPGALLEFPLTLSSEGKVVVVSSDGTVACGASLCYLNGITFRAES